MHPCCWMLFLESPARDCLQIPCSAQYSELWNSTTVPMSISGEVGADVACGADCPADHADGDTGAHPAVPGTCRLRGAIRSHQPVSATANVLIMVILLLSGLHLIACTACCARMSHCASPSGNADEHGYSCELHALQPPQAVVSVLSAIAGLSRAAIDPSVQQIFRSAVCLCQHCNQGCKGRRMTAE